MWMCTNLGESNFPRDFNTTLMFAIRFLNLMRHEHNDFASFVKLSFARRYSKLKNLAPICSCLHYTGSSLVLPLPDFEWKLKLYLLARIISSANQEALIGRAY